MGIIKFSIIKLFGHKILFLLRIKKKAFGISVPTIINFKVTKSIKNTAVCYRGFRVII
jgi:hypothetical protein